MLERWQVLTAVCAVAIFCEMVAWVHLLAFTPLFLGQELGLAPTETAVWTGVLAAVSMVIALPLGPFWGVLAERYSRRLLILRCPIVEFVSYILIIVSQDVWMFLAARVLFGFVFGNSALMIAAIASSAPPNRTNTAIGLFNTAFPLAAVAGPLLGALLVGQVGLRGMFTFDLVLVATSIFCITFLFREVETPDRTTPILAKLKIVGNQAATVPAIRWNFITWFFAALAIQTLEPYIPLILTREAEAAGLDPAATIGIVYAIGGAFTTIITPLAGPLIDRVGPTRVLPVIGVFGALVSLGMVMSLGLLATSILVVLLTVPRTVHGIVMYAHLVQHVELRHRSAVVSLSPLPYNTASLIGPALGAAVSGFGLAAVLLIGAIQYLGATLCSLRLHQVSAKGSEDEPTRRLSPANPPSE